MISVTDQALGQLKTLLAQQENPEMGLRVYVTPGGCSGFSYGMGFDDAPAGDDEVSEQDGIKVFVDPYSATYLEGAEIDYIDSLMGGGFTVHNPQAVRTCSCGSSFDAGDGAGAAKACSAV
ncbi:MAG: iron-sulfur cluster insertion protein ErpA [Candidatus Dormibacteraeota bacterium]|nr:iron-sulfur cluster insertion protein ErpA [Candidatus Dormibacteraeota bacterium]